ncbi:bifunctional acetate--CoA ligase family protein/GNAT family N-acetyltransferase [Pollutimonas thiosulfatoxidans]|uniref:GNAT family N-acetyltransferase n=1 Tax=Pollutimonas thiosulfatoxidans TaxID=2028345 RepID=A0A410GDC7_9BURK|nr:GNAT family N-acetyltransferase [Pollutimonas thiosulfatoxidans]QAA94269.1 GNAT family N-acetyltransferase [Pollutimonas thiosulfatoxidans]
MPRHRLASLFEPRTLLVLAESELTLMATPPRCLHNAVSTVPVASGQPITLPTTLAGVAAGARLDLALVCVAPARLPEALESLKPARPRSLVVLAHPQASADPVEDIAYCRAWATLQDCTLLGPRAFGLQRPHLGLNLTHQPKVALSGRVALVAQSRSITSAVLDWAEDIDLGFSAVVSLGDEAGVDIPDVLDYLAMDTRTESIVLYLEDASSSRRFTSALRAAASVKPVVVLKSGHKVLRPSIEDAVFNALLRRAGAVRIRYFVQLFSALKVMVHTRRVRGRKIALFSNGNGASQLAIDVIGDNESVFPAELAQSTIKALRDLLEPGASTVNPIVTHAPLSADKVQRVVALLEADTGVDGVLVLLAPDPLSDLEGVARQVAGMAAQARKPIVSCFMGDAGMRALRQVLDRVGTPAFRTPESAANAFGILGAYHYNQTLAQQTLPPEPLGKPPLLDKARALVAHAQQERRRSLTPQECEQLLACFHIPVRVAAQADAHGIDREDNMPMSIRVRRDPRYGPYFLFGSGGDDALIAGGFPALELPPLNRYLARKLVQRSDLWRGALSRQMTPAAFENLLEALENLSQAVSELPALDSFLIDPLYADDMQLIALGVQVDLRSESMLVLPETTGYRHMAIHPYPRGLVQAKTFKDGQPWMLRPIRPEDAEPLQEFVRGLSDESRYMRFVSMLRELTPRMLARYTAIDYDRELALVATVQMPNPLNRGHPREQIIGFAHYLRNADGRGAEYALVIGDAWQRRGLGAQLMRGLIDAAQQQGLTYIDGVVLASNRPMLALMTHLGFQNDQDLEDATMRRVWLNLGETGGVQSLYEH